MSRRWITTLGFGLALSILAALFTPVAFAGPPLVCWPFDIGGARSLPWGGHGWHDLQPDYDLSRLTSDTLAFLAPDTPILVRIETLRRAAIYADKEPSAARDLLTKLQARAESSPADPLLLFDWGYFVEAYRQAAKARNSTSAFSAPKVNGYDLVLRALQRRGTDASMEFAAALVASAVGQRDAASQHLAKAAAGVEEGSLLAKNILTHAHLFHIRAGTIAEVRSQLVAAK